MATEHPGMGPYDPGPGETGGSQPAENSEPTTPISVPGTQGTRFDDPIPTLPLPGMPDPTAAMHTPPDLGSEDPDIGGAVGHPPEPETHGRIERQEAGVTQPRPPTVAEARARDKARKRAEEAEHAAEQALEAKKSKRKKMFIGGAAVVGVAAVVGAGYLACEASEPDVTAYCVTDDNGQQSVVNDNDCVAAQNYATSTGAYHSGLPAVFFFNGHQYRYYYGGTNAVGHPPVGGTFSEPSGAHISTKSGDVIRGGLGSRSGGSSGGS